jgi:hypothetical protein
MNSAASTEFLMPESHRLGWNCGFYATAWATPWPASGRLAPLLLYGPRTDDDRLFLAGYRAGCAARFGWSAGVSTST